MSIRAKVVLLVLLSSMVPFAAIGVISYLSSRNALEENIAQVLQSGAHEAAGKLDDFFGKAAVDFNSWSTLRIMQDVLTDDVDGEIANTLTQIKTQYGHFAAFVVTNDQGVAIAATDASHKDRDLSQSPFVKSALKGTSFQSAVGPSDLVKVETLILALPLRASYDAETIIGTIVGFVDWTRVRALMADIPVSGSAQDEAHYLILRPRAGGQPLHSPTNVSVEAEKMSSTAGAASVSSGGRDFLIGTALSNGSGAFKNPEWLIHTGVATQIAYESVYNLRNQLVLIAILLALATAGAGYIAAVRLSQPIVAMTRAMGVLASGDAGFEVPGQGRSDEIGDMARATKIFQDNAIERERLEAEQKREQASREERQRAIEALVGRFRSTVQELLQSVGADMTQMQATAKGLGGIAENTAAQATQTASASEEASANVQTVACATEELTASIAKISRKVSDTTTIVGEATEAARSTNDKVASLDQAARKIGDVITLIQDIAEQTNLLALNATIEAARAGDAGRGFAVVASEVKSLATQTAKATEEIAQQIGAIQSSTVGAVEAINQIASLMEKVNEYTSTIAAAVEEQGSATSEISRNVQEAATGTQMVAESMAAMTKAAADTSESAEEAERASSSAAQQTTQLKTAIDGFLKDVAAA